MPRITNDFLQCVFYLYPSREAAERGEHVGGTGFVAGVESATVPGLWFPYGVSCKHVVHRDGCSVARVNLRGGGTDFFEFEPHEWQAHPTGEDLAIAPMLRTLVASPPHELVAVHERAIITREAVHKEDIGPGDEVFMVGRFIRHDGKQTNVPSARFGNLSIMPMIMHNPSTGGDTESFAVEMRSMPGYSGSPVFVYQTPWDFRNVNLDVRRVKAMLLGVNWGYIVDEAEVRERILTVKLASLRPGEKELRYVLVNTGMNGVVPPAWKLSELLHMPALEADRARLDERLARAQAKEQEGQEVVSDGSPAG